MQVPDVSEYSRGVAGRHGRCVEAAHRPEHGRSAKACAGCRYASATLYEGRIHHVHPLAVQTQLTLVMVVWLLGDVLRIMVLHE